MKYRDNSINEKKDYYYSKIEEDYVEKVYKFLNGKGKLEGKRNRESLFGNSELINISLEQFRNLVMDNATIEWYGSKLTYVKYWYNYIRKEHPNTLFISYDEFLKRLQTWTDIKLKENESLEKKAKSLTLFSDYNGYITLLVSLIIIAYPIRFIIYLILLNYNIYNSNEY